jgi:hypothetical protein
MPGKQEIEFIIRPDGTVEERVIGVAGPECEQITAGIEQALGTISHREHSSGYFSQGQSAEETLNTGH